MVSPFWKTILWSFAPWPAAIAKTKLYNFHHLKHNETQSDLKGTISKRLLL